MRGGSALAKLRDRTLEELNEAIESDESEHAIALANRMRNELIWIHDLFFTVEHVPIVIYRRKSG